MYAKPRTSLLIQIALLGAVATACANSGSQISMPKTSTAGFTQDAGNSETTATTAIGDASAAELIRDQQITQIATQINTNQNQLLTEQHNHSALEQALTITQEGGIPVATDPTATGTTISTAGAVLGTGVDVFTGNYFGAIVDGFSGLKNLNSDSQSINQQKLTAAQVATNSAALETQIAASTAKINTLEATIASLQTQINQLIAQDPDKAAAEAAVTRGQAAALPATASTSGTIAAASASGTSAAVSTNGSGT